MINYELGLLIAIFGYVYTNILTDVDMILNFVYNQLDQRITKHRWLFHMIIHCEKCVSGQVALWIYLITNFHKYNLLQHIFFITYTILIVEIIKQTHKRLKNE